MLLVTWKHHSNNFSKNPIPFLLNHLVTTILDLFYTLKQIHALVMHSRKIELQPVPVIFNDGRLVKRPTPATALLILIWIPFGMVLSPIRILSGFILPMWIRTHAMSILGCQIIVKGKPSQPREAVKSGVLFVCNHRTLMDPIVISTVLGRRVIAVVYSLSRFSKLFSPIPIYRANTKNPRC